MKSKRIETYRQFKDFLAAKPEFKEWLGKHYDSAIEQWCSEKDEHKYFTSNYSTPRISDIFSAYNGYKKELSDIEYKVTCEYKDEEYGIKVILTRYYNDSYYSFKSMRVYYN